VALGSASLAGKVVGIDPGHNGDNWAHPEIIDALVNDGVGQKACDTTGTETSGGYTEAAFNLAVAQDLASDLTAEGARVVMTRGSNDGVGPCVDQRAEMINQAGAQVAVSIHADGGPTSGRGFAVLEPSGAGQSGPIVGSSAQLGQDVASALQAAGMPPSNYDGVNGIGQRSDLAGLNLAAQPKVLVEVGNMQNDQDVALLTSADFQQAVARGLAQAITDFLAG
jgi:N-acetylmuramoyl-L-alanine amidase